jgi:hypothetical protein
MSETVLQMVGPNRQFSNFSELGCFEFPPLSAELYATNGSQTCDGGQRPLCSALHAVALQSPLSRQIKNQVIQ